MSKKKIIRFGLPKGSLEKATIEKMAKAGYNIRVSNRSLVPYIDDPEIEIRLIRAQEISRYVELGYLDCGITGLDWVMENGSKVHEVTELLFSRATRRPARWVLCVPEESPVKSVKGLNGKRIATEVVNLTKKYLRKNGVKANVEFSWGATEVKAVLPLYAWYHSGFLTEDVAAKATEWEEEATRMWRHRRAAQAIATAIPSPGALTASPAIGMGTPRFSSAPVDRWPSG